MQPSKKSAMPVPKPAAHSYLSHVKNTGRKKANSTQTDKNMSQLEEPFKSELNLKDEFIFDEKDQTTYSAALNYINSMHNFMNKKLYENYGECGDTNSEANSVFKLPQVPNYAAVFIMLVEKSKSQNFMFNQIRIPDDVCIKSNPTGVKKLAEIKSVEQRENLVLNNDPHEVQKDNAEGDISNTVEGDFILFNKPSEIHITQRDADISYVKKAETYTQKNRIIGDILENKIRSENCAPAVDLEKGQEQFLTLDKNEDKQTEETNSGHTMEKLNILQDDKQNTSNTIGETIHKNLGCIYHESIMDIIKKQVQEELITHLNITNSSLLKSEKQTNLVSSNHHVINIQPQINLLEYAQKKLERKINFEFDSTTSCRNDDLLMLQKQCFNNVTSSNSSTNVRPSTSKKVTNMFEKISQKALHNSTTSEERREDFANCDNQSDSDSVILDDEEFEKLSKRYYYKENSNLAMEKHSPGNNQEKPHPLRLTEKDITKLNEKMLSAIGLFTERGDIRPDIIDIMEKEKQAKAASSRNKQFRVKRQWDVQVHFRPKNCINTSVASVSTEKSFISVSSDIKSDVEHVKNE